MTNKQKRVYAARKAVITKDFLNKKWECIQNMKFYSLAALKAVRTRKMNQLNKQFKKV